MSLIRNNLLVAQPLATGVVVLTLLAACDDGGAAGLGPDRTPDDGGTERDVTGGGDDVEHSDAAGDVGDVADDGTDAVESDAGSDSNLPLDIVSDASDDADDVAVTTDTMDTVDDAGDGCVFKDTVLGDHARPVLIGHPFSSTPGVDGTRIRRLTLERDGTLVDEGEYLDVGFEPARIEMFPSGEIALVIGSRGEIASVQLEPALRELDEALLPSAGYGDVMLVPSEGLAFVVGLNSVETGGVSVVRVECDGSLTVLDDSFYPLRLAASMVALDESRALLLGGQTVFEPIDDFDIRLLQRNGAELVEIDAFDIFGDIVSTGRIGISPEGDRVLIANNSIASSEASLVLVLAVEGDEVREVQRITGLDDPSEVAFSPDGKTAVVTLVEPGRIVVLRRNDDGTFEETNRITGIGLPDQIGRITRGPNAGLLLVPSIDGSGVSNVAILRFGAPGVVEDLGQLDLGEAIADIPDAIGVPQ